MGKKEMSFLLYSGFKHANWNKRGCEVPPSPLSQLWSCISSQGRAGTALNSSEVFADAESAETPHDHNTANIPLAAIQTAALGAESRTLPCISPRPRRNFNLAAWFFNLFFSQVSHLPPTSLHNKSCFPFNLQCHLVALNNENTEKAPTLKTKF